MHSKEEGKGKNFQKTRAFFKKMGYLLWKDESLLGWIVIILTIIILIKFIIFPTLHLITGTSLPLAIVESCSMHHENKLLEFNDFENWWERNEEKYLKEGINKSQFEDFDFKRGFTKGDIIFITGVKPEEIELGDIIIFQSDKKTPIIHRVIDIKNNTQLFFSTLGDNNQGQIEFEKSIPEENILGKARVKILPYVGWIKLIFFENMKNPSDRGLCSER
jgi:signal peptidase I